MGSMLCRDHKCSSGIRHFQRAVNTLKMNPALEDLSTSKTDNNVELVRFLLRSDRRLTVRMIASELDLNHTTVHQILTEELAMKKIVCEVCSQKPDNRTEGQSEGRVSSSSGTDPK